MIRMVLGNSLWQLIVQSDIVTKIVLLFLLGMSVICWAIFFYKLVLLRIKKKEMKVALGAMKQANSMEKLLQVASTYAKTLPGYYLSKNLVFLKSLLDTDPGKQNLNDRECELMQNHIVQNIDEMILQEESYLAVLSTTAAASPLIGLFGTVWGLVHSFVRISELQAADITVVAPGIAEALITTLAGLAVAVPALVMFNYCSSKVRETDQLFTILSDKLIIKIQKYAIK